MQANGDGFEAGCRQQSPQVAVSRNQNDSRRVLYGMRAKPSMDECGRGGKEGCRRKKKRKGRLAVEVNGNGGGEGGV